MTSTDVLGFRVAIFDNFFWIISNYSIWRQKNLILSSHYGQKQKKLQLLKIEKH